MRPLPRLAIGTPPSRDRIKSILERIAIDRNHKCKAAKARPSKSAVVDFDAFLSAEVGQARLSVRRAP
jgi:hypothetical protein